MTMTYVDHIIQSTVLSDGRKNRLVVCRGVDRSQTVDTRSETRSYGNAENAIRVRGSIDTFEECKLGGICSDGLIQTSDLLDDDVRVANDLTGCVELLGC